MWHFFAKTAVKFDILPREIGWALHTDNVRATLQSLQRRDPRRLPASYNKIVQKYS